MKKKTKRYEKLVCTVSAIEKTGWSAGIYKYRGVIGVAAAAACCCCCCSCCCCHLFLISVSWSSPLWCVLDKQFSFSRAHFIVYRMKWKIIEHTFCWGIPFGLLPSENSFDNIHTNIVFLPTLKNERFGTNAFSYLGKSWDSSLSFRYKNRRESIWFICKSFCTWR